MAIEPDVLPEFSTMRRARSGGPVSFREVVRTAIPEEFDYDLDSIPDAAPRTIMAGDIFHIDGSYIMCADSADPYAISKLVSAAGCPPSAMWTDPPYGVSYVGKTKDALTVSNDGIADFKRVMVNVFSAVNGVLLDGAPIYVASPSGKNMADFLSAFESCGWAIRQSLVWLKDTIVLGHSDYHYEHEIVIYGYKKPMNGRFGRGGDIGWHGGNDQGSVIRCPRPKVSTTHPTMKPVALVVHHILNSTKPGDMIVDPFCGSGTTLIASVLRGRRCMAIDISPEYVDVAVRRWERLTGKPAERLNDLSAIII